MHEIFSGQTTSFEVVKNSSLLTLFIKCLWFRPSGYPVGWNWINGIILISARVDVSLRENLLKRMQRLKLKQAFGTKISGI
jgi:hypothetical protein